MPLTFKVIFSGVLLLITLSLVSLREMDAPPAIPIQQRLVQQADSLIISIKQFKALPVDVSHTRLMQLRFKQIRLAYKRLEWAAEYFDPLSARQVNGPPVPEVELSGQVIQPDGLQVMEECLFPRFKVSDKKKLAGLVNRLAVNANEFRTFFSHVELQDWQVFDAAKLEVFKIETQGLNNFDDPLLQNCFAESAAALQSVNAAINHYKQAIDFGPSIRYLLRDVTFNRFDRAAFMLRFANPLTAALTSSQHRLHLFDVHYNRLLCQDAATLFNAGAFNRNAFIAALEDSATTDKILLGKRLFNDPILSGNGSRSCASCHKPGKAFTDGLIKNLDITGKKFITRNTPTLINAALQPALFYDLRALSLEDQANDVVQNPDEMHGDMKIAVGKLWQDSSYRAQFSLAYLKKDRMQIDTFEVFNALSGYIRSLTRLNSRFDSYMRGDAKSITTFEKAGFNLFMGKAKCSTCHYLPLFNGALPPRYMQMETEVIGVPKSKNGKRIDPDPGVYGITPYSFNRYAFKTTTVRNAALTAPYMHNGVFSTLEEVIDFYDKGGGIGTGVAISGQTLPADQLRLTKTEKLQLVAFIKSLNSE